MFVICLDLLSVTQVHQTEIGLAANLLEVHLYDKLSVLGWQKLQPHQMALISRERMPRLWMV
ncbi:MAG TPA: hypothetical protein DD619_02850 [Alphaproteobacteria bacterium]|nr:hypothetical protein [Alphaproteobacteria bacterium]